MPTAKTPKAQAVRPQSLPIELPMPDGSKRPMEAVYPTEEQLTVWQSAGERFSRLGEEWGRREAHLANAADDDPRKVEFNSERARQAARTLGRALSMVQSALVHERDRDWLEDQLMYGQMTLEDMLGVIRLVTEALRSHAAAGKPEPSAKAANKPRLTA